MSRRTLATLALLAGGGTLLWWLRDQQLVDAPIGVGPGGGYTLFPGPIDAGDYAAGGDWVEIGLLSRGIAAGTARGVAAGSYAESLQDPYAINPTSGAFGVGQWLGSRKAALFARYGPNPSPAQQLDFLAWELRGGDHGGAAVLAQSTPAGALDAYIRAFMRPGAGTAGDLARGQRYLS